MPQHVYEGMFILDSNRYARDAAGTVSTIPSTIEQFGGKMLASRLWEERRLAYPIKGQRKGTYWLTYFKLDGDKLDEFDSAVSFERRHIAQPDAENRSANCRRHGAARPDRRRADGRAEGQSRKPRPSAASG